MTFSVVAVAVVVVELYFVAKFVPWNRIFRTVEEEVNFVFNFIRSARGEEPILSLYLVRRIYHIQTLTYEEEYFSFSQENPVIDTGIDRI